MSRIDWIGLSFDPDDAVAFNLTDAPRCSTVAVHSLLDLAFPRSSGIGY